MRDIVHRGVAHHCILPGAAADGVLHSEDSQIVDVAAAANDLVDVLFGLDTAAAAVVGNAGSMLVGFGVGVADSALAGS